MSPLITYYIRDSSIASTPFWRKSHEEPAPIASARDGVRQTLDVMFDWEFRLGSADGAAYLQFRDVLPWGDLYKDASRSVCIPAATDCPNYSRGSIRHRTRWIPNLGLRFRF